MCLHYAFLSHVEPLGSIISVSGMAGEAKVTEVGSPKASKVITAGELILTKRVLNFIILQCFLEPSEPKGGVSTGEVSLSTSAEISDAGKLKL